MAPAQPGGVAEASTKGPWQWESLTPEGKQDATLAGIYARVAGLDEDPPALGLGIYALLRHAQLVLCVALQPDVPGLAPSARGGKASRYFFYTSSDAPQAATISFHVTALFGRARSAGEAPPPRGKDKKTTASRRHAGQRGQVHREKCVMRRVGRRTTDRENKETS